MRLGGAKYGDAIDKLKTECMDPDMENQYKERIEQWRKDECIIKDQLLEIGTDVKGIKEALQGASNTQHIGVFHWRKSFQDC